MISFIGMQTVKEKLATDTFQCKMESEVTNLDEVVVVGYGTSSVKDLTGSVASVGLKQLSQLNTPNVTSMLQTWQQVYRCHRIPVFRVRQSVYVCVVLRH